MSEKSQRPLFLPLKREYYLAFERGEKDTEYRLRGPRWNADTCRVGRKVILSCGYGRARRMTGTITGFHYDTTPSKLPGWLECYGPRAGDAACIRIALTCPQCHGAGLVPVTIGVTTADFECPKCEGYGLVSSVKSVVKK